MNIEDANKTLLEIKDILDGAGVSFYLVDGAALGVKRDGGLMPHDTDIDLRVWAKDWDFLTLFNEFKKAGFRCKKSINKRLYRDKPSGSILHKRGIKVDICLGYYYPPDDKIVVLAGAPRDHVTVLPARFFRDVDSVIFLGSKFKVPSPIEEYLDYRYGRDWRIPVKKKYWQPACVPISIEKYVEYFHQHPEVNKKDV